MYIICTVFLFLTERTCATAGRDAMWMLVACCASHASRVASLRFARFRMLQAWDLPTLPAGGTAAQQVSQPTRAEKPASPSSIVLLSCLPLAMITSLSSRGLQVFIQSCSTACDRDEGAMTHEFASLGRGFVLLHQLNLRMLLLDSSLARLSSGAPEVKFC